jgi:hypothetical protein
MKRRRILLDKLRLLTGSEDTPRAVPQDQSVFSRLAVPYTFSPSLSLGGALVAVAACLTRIFSACVLFAVWGGFCVLAWDTIENHFWRAAAVLPLVLLFVAALAILMMVISLAERAIAPKR